MKKPVIFLFLASIVFISHPLFSASILQAPVQPRQKDGGGIVSANRALRLSLRGTHSGGLASGHGDLEPENTGAQSPLGNDLARSQAGRPLDSDRPGQLLWKFETGGVVYSSPAIGSSGTVYVGSLDMKDSKVYALDGKSGAKLWEFATGSSVWSSPAIGSDGSVYVGSETNKVYALDGKSGVKKWEFVAGSYVRSSPAIGTDGAVYVGSFDHKVYALDGKSGVKLWEFKTGGIVYSSPAIGSDGTVYVGSNDKKLYAIKTDSKGLAKSPWPMRGQNARHTGRAPAK